MDNDYLNPEQQVKLKDADDEFKHLRIEFARLKEQFANERFSTAPILRPAAISRCEPELYQLVEHLEEVQRKLNYRIKCLKQAIEEEKSSKKPKKDEVRCAESSVSALKSLTVLLTEATKRVYPDVPSSAVSVVPTNKATFGDYQCNVVMAINQLLKSKGKNVSPPEIAKNIIQNIPKNNMIEKVSVAGAGFINICLKQEYAENYVRYILLNEVKPPAIDKPLRVIVDFSSPNVAKEMHVGHLRSTIIGDSIANLLEYLGHDVLRLNHVGDWGTQFGMLVAHLQDTYPDYLTTSPSVDNLQRFYKESKRRFDHDEAFKKRAYESVVQLQSLNEDYIKAWQLICDASRNEFQKIYERLNVRLVERGESFYHNSMKDVVQELDEKGLLETDEGRKIMWGKGVSIPLTIVKSDGGFTYDTSDIAAIKYRIQEEKADWIIYVIDEGQGVHIELVAACAEKAGYLDRSKVKVDFVGFGVMLGDDNKKFKTRSGDAVKLVDLLDEGLKRALDKLKEKGRDEVLSEEELKTAQEAIAYNCIKYSDLTHNRNSAYVFSFDKMLEDKGNTAVYLLYTYTRIASIARKANVSREVIKEEAKKPFKLNQEKEWKLAKVLLQFYNVIERIPKDFYMHKLCEYLYELSTTFSEFYDTCYVIEKSREGEPEKIHMNRIILCETTALVMKKGFDILGLKTVTRM